MVRDEAAPGLGDALEAVEGVGGEEAEHLDQCVVGDANVGAAAAARCLEGPGLPMPSTCKKVSQFNAGFDCSYQKGKPIVVRRRQGKACHRMRMGLLRLRAE
jgi:hypothetical protein